MYEAVSPYVWCLYWWSQTTHDTYNGTFTSGRFLETILEPVRNRAQTQPSYGQTLQSIVHLPARDTQVLWTLETDGVESGALQSSGSLGLTLISSFCSNNVMNAADDLQVLFYTFNLNIPRYSPWSFKETDPTVNTINTVNTILKVCRWLTKKKKHEDQSPRASHLLQHWRTIEDWE